MMRRSIRRGMLLAAWMIAAPAVAQTPAAPQPPAPGIPPAPAPDAWQQRPAFELTALDKVTARTLALTGRVGQPVKYGSLTITVRSCLVRPPDQAADAAAFVDIVDARQDMPRFSGWMLLSEPSVSMLEHPVYDIRLIACRA